MTLYKKELNNKVAQFQSAIGANIKEIIFTDAAFRDYLAMFEIKIKGIKYGKIILYYKPTKKTFSLKLNIKDADLLNTFQGIWDKLNGQANYEKSENIYEIYVDGSYIDGKTGYGAVIFHGDNIKAELYGAAKTTQFRQFAGELKAVIVALNWCVKNNVEKARVNYDYAGVEKFATGAWKAKNEVSEYYVNYFKKTPLKIEWRHIKSHTGNARNDKADILAKKGAQC